MNRDYANCQTSAPSAINTRYLEAMIARLVAKHGPMEFDIADLVHAPELAMSVHLAFGTIAVSLVPQCEPSGGAVTYR